MSAAALASSAKSRQPGADPVRQAVQRLARALPARTDATVTTELLEDELREGLEALGDVEAHFSDVLALLRAGRLSPVTLLEAGDDARVLRRLDYLNDVVVRLRRRLSQSAALLHGR